MKNLLVNIVKYESYIVFNYKKSRKKIFLSTLFFLIIPFCFTHAETLKTTIIVDANADRHAISPLIYGISFGTTTALKDLRSPLNRSGGNNASTYNWNLDARNAGKDWYYESLACDPAIIYDQFNDHFISLTQLANAAAMLTIPMLEWSAKLGPNRHPLASFSISKYGPQEENDPNFFDAGNGVLTDGNPISNADPNDAAVPNTVLSQKNRIIQLSNIWSRKNTHYYILDNEPSIWHLAHRNLQPIGIHADEFLKKTLNYSKMIKETDKNAQVVAPEEWGWLGYHYSGYDQYNAATHGLEHAPDRSKLMQDMDYIPWLLSKWKEAGHPVDIFSLHFYPQEGEYSESSDRSIELARNRSTRVLWDPNYKDPTWINAVVELIPLMRRWVNEYYIPGTPIALTEYNWGGDELMNGATAQADLLGIFGREKLDIATRWATPNANTPVYKAMKLYRDYDDRGGDFGDISIKTTVTNPDLVSAFSAVRQKDNSITIMIINKQLEHDADITLFLQNIPQNGNYKIWQLAKNKISTLSENHYKNGMLQSTLPPQSVTLFVIAQNSH